MHVVRRSYRPRVATSFLGYRCTYNASTTGQLSSIDVKKPCQTPVAGSSIMEPHHVLIFCCLLGTGLYRAAAVGAKSSSAQRGPAQPGAHTQRPAVQCPAIEQSAVLLQRNGGGGRAKTYEAQAAPSPLRMFVHVDIRSVVAGRNRQLHAGVVSVTGRGLARLSQMQATHSNRSRW